MGKMQEVESLMVINNGERYLSVADYHNRIEARIIGRVEAAERIHGETPKVTYRRETNGQVSRNGGKFGLRPKEFVDQMLGLTISIANDGYGEFSGWPYLQPNSNPMPLGRLVCCLMAKPEDILALCLFRYGFSETGIEDRYSCDYSEVNTRDLNFGFGMCARYQEQGVALPVQKVELFSEVDRLYWDSNHISHLWV